MAHSLKGHTGEVFSVAITGNQVLATGSADFTVKLWDLATDKETITLQGHRNVVFAVAFSITGDKLASGDGDGTVRVWDLTVARKAGKGR